MKRSSSAGVSPDRASQRLKSSPSLSATAIHIFTRDLRFDDNLSLHALFSSNKFANVRPIFVFTPEQTRDNSYFGARSFAFLVASLKDLQKQIDGAKSELSSSNNGTLLGGLEVYYGRHEDVLTDIIKYSNGGSGSNAVTQVTIAQDFTPYARDREDRISNAIMKLCSSVTFTVTKHEHSLTTDLLDVRSGAGSIYKVFTPFWKNVSAKKVAKPVSIMTLPHNSGSSSPKKNIASSSTAGKYAYSLDKAASEFLTTPEEKIFYQQYLGMALSKNSESSSSSVPETNPPIQATRAWALKRLQTFPFNKYKAFRDDTGNNCTLLSPFLKFGIVSVRECVDVLESSRRNDTTADSRMEFVRELYWRDFYQYVGWHFPHILNGMKKPISISSLPKLSTSSSTNKTSSDSESDLSFPHANENFSNEFRGATIAWKKGEIGMKDLEKWKTGTTGVPLVDAGMRELLKTGFMHNRCRMVCAMFLTKNLLIDWRVGERFFAQTLTDYDPLSNNGGWQWSSSTGADGSPYFRIMNAQSQLNKVDPKLVYTRKWLGKIGLNISRGEKDFNLQVVSDKDLLKWEEDKHREKYIGKSNNSNLNSNSTVTSTSKAAPKAGPGSLLAAMGKNSSFGQSQSCLYPAPCVDLKKSREVAIAVFKAAVEKKKAMG